MSAQVDLPAFCTLLTDIKDKIAGVNARVAPLMSKIESGALPTAQGVSLLEVRMHSLLSYITNLGFLTLLKLHGKSIANHPVVDRLVELRAVLERTKPLEQKLKYQIDKLVKAALMDDDSKKLVKDLGEGGEARTDGDAGLRNPLQFKPNPAALIDADDGRTEKVDTGDEPAVYRPPRVAPMRYEENAQTRKGRLSKEAKERLSKSRLMSDIQRDYDDRPEEMDAEGTGYSAKSTGGSFGRAGTKDDERIREREEFEEANFIRLTLSKKDKKLERQLQTRGHLMRFENEFKDIDADFRELSGIQRAVDNDEEARFGKGLEGKRQRQSEMFSQDKRTKYSSVDDLIKQGAADRRSLIGRATFQGKKRLFSKQGGKAKSAPKNE